jgi:two-component sensor histidine kinase
MAAGLAAKRSEFPVRTRDGAVRQWSFVTSSLGLQPDGRRLFLSTGQDTTDRKEYEERVDLLIREARHRTKNILGLVQTVARQTAANEKPEFVESFCKRIQALAANQDLLVKNQWQGADVEDLVRAQLAPFMDLIGSRIAMHGPQLRLNPAATQAVGLAVHELATNAGKYGALSTDGGHVDVDWRSDADRFEMNWTERGGPSVRPPCHRGFGSTVIESLAKRAVAGEVALDYGPSGFGWHLTCPKANALELTESSTKIPAA